MTLKIKCTYVAEGEPFTLGKEYDIYFEDGGLFYIKNDVGRKVGEFKDGYSAPIDGLLEALHAEYHANFTPCVTLEPEKRVLTPKEKINIILDKATELIYNNQEELNISFDDFITLVKIKEELK